ncbi:dTDP-4-dehydrorhamnose reductase [Defluviimonas sp. 20V17]|uniref:dTDP-4-dehydrorhamnose reductase n=1 Tax=Allgaiera indica TaxID=765699 RepID=A0AAN4UMP6_9RHOB|nr:dTDP-4-dehydrorhamnose reductase [Allgaiera indica]KDB03518.1 dTDP-4-dehydrorhamnose reductase [Defluviimonas sp. 20V17]GHD98056.1 NAD(P)-dependent oxidoreductase [Allgaiera indica]SDW54877.1 dTDP-4-dehydrorhamnose reductase [Allgaiera indica]
MRLLIFGKTGQLAQELARIAPGATFLDRAAADLTDPDRCAAIVRDTPAEAIINAAAYTAVDRAEAEPEAAAAINGRAPAAMARAAAGRGLPFLHVSTDYVFDGSGRAPWKPGDRTAPLGAYGRSKLAGEMGIRLAAGTHAILRTSWVFSRHGTNFVKTMLRLGAERDALNVVADQIGGPTPAADIAAALLAMAEGLLRDPGRAGTYHFSGTPDVSWADFAREIFARAGLACAVTDIPSSAYPTPAPRPLNSRLDCSDISTTFGIDRPDWRQGLAQVLEELRQP